MKSDLWTKRLGDRRGFIGGSDARIIMGADATKLIRLWREKRGEIAPEDLSQDLVVQLGTITEELNRTWYERCTGYAVEDVQRRVRHPVHKWMGATLDCRVQQTGAVFEAKFMLPWSFSEEAAAERHMAQLQHNMWVTASRSAVLSIITGGMRLVPPRAGPRRICLGRCTTTGSFGLVGHAAPPGRIGSSRDSDRRRRPIGWGRACRASRMTWPSANRPGKCPAWPPTRANLRRGRPWTPS
jgi:YqaJ-like viral recombinase domain